MCVKLNVLTTASNSSPLTRQLSAFRESSLTGVFKCKRALSPRAMPSVIDWKPPSRG
jgi:hypothetical protein